MSLLIEYIEKLSEKIKFQDGEFWYRGQSDAEWALQPGAIQRVAGEVYKVDELISYHEELLEEVRLIGGEKLGTDRRELGDLELLTELQHYGAATCLLDMTSNFSIALWFACQKAGGQGQHGKEKDGKVFIAPYTPINKHIDFFKVRSDELGEKIDYFLNPGRERKNKENEGEEKKSFAQICQEITGNKERKARFWFWKPKPSMRRMLSQSSRFIFSSYDISNFGPYDITKKKDGIYYEIVVKADHKEGLLSELKQKYGLKPQDIFSDIPGLASVNARSTPHRFKQYKDYLLAGKKRLQEEDFENAFKNFDRANRLQPEDPEILFMLGKDMLRWARAEGIEFLGKDTTWDFLVDAENYLGKALNLAEESNRQKLQNEIKEELKKLEQCKKGFKNAFRESDE